MGPAGNGSVQFSERGHLSTDRDHRKQLAALPLHDELATYQAGHHSFRKGGAVLLHFSVEETSGNRMPARNPRHFGRTGIGAATSSLFGRARRLYETILCQ